MTGSQSRHIASAGDALPQTLSVAIVGAGPAGFYVASKLSKRAPGASIDILEALPCPYGLVRSGVAPDHPETKNVMHQFRDVMKAGTVEYFGNVQVGKDVSLKELRGMYDAVVLSYGAGGGKRLQIPGQGLQNVMSARDFVNWYNGVPNSTVFPQLEGVTSVVVCGLGNVALDCARVLLKDAATQLHATDMASRAVRALECSHIEHVHVLSRRGPAQAACTPKELREMLGVEGVRVWVHPEGVLDTLGEACLEELKGSRIHRRVVDVLRKRVADGDPKDDDDRGDLPGGKHLHLHFLSSPVEYRGTGKVEETVVEKMKLDATRKPQRALSAGETFTVASQLVIESVGYKAEPMEGAPFDARSGVVPNVLGRVENSSDLYCCGWLKRGPSGIIGTNLVDAEQTVDTMVRHVEMKKDARLLAESTGRGWGRAGLTQLLAARGHRAVSFKDWERIDAEEIRLGERAGKPREKITEVKDMLRVAEVEPL
jgi:adrenodoxin-NADP+ reductase